MAEVFDLTFDSASDEDCAPADCAAPGYKNHNAPGRREAPEAPRRRSVPTKRFSEEYAPPRGDVDEADNEPSIQALAHRAIELAKVELKDLEQVSKE